MIKYPFFSLTGVTTMRTFVTAVVFAILIAIGFALALNSIENTAEMQFTTGAVRL